MDYYFTKRSNLGFDDTIAKVTDLLQAEGFGVLTEIDVKATLKKKLDVDFRPYRILGACNPPFAHKALQIEDKVGLMMPCNVVVQKTTAGEVEVSAVDPVAAMAVVEIDELRLLADDIRGRLERVIAAI